ncbi:hypothetical protein IQ269_08000 [Tychonema sp. LEGE 07199]|uniref:hypothetical protein n=1 Tax=unclassified Tychonema TaxID=2642144 RepID=UPI00187F882E|nr:MULTISPECIES: hypothetical protein [unclassified Tychonema]MBE9120761.1 hypothetical protein [Tychonema sp. LEGE 07199]MBE9133359.1 hypothetical protein [Tychonema sp. LEGE 07196]
MTPTKLSDSDKRELLRLYRQSDENTITLAKRYGVSSSTVRRIIQGALSESEYEFLVQQKQKRSSTSSTVSEPKDETASPAAEGETDPAGVPLSESVPVPKSASNSRPTPTKRSLSNAQSDLVSALPDTTLSTDVDRSDSAAVTGEQQPVLLEAEKVAGEDFSDFEEDEDDEDEDDLDDDDGDDLDDFDEDLEDEDSLFEASLLGSMSGDSIEFRATGVIQVLPLSEASVPQICYLVVDRASELITRPLKAFGELGQIPAIEIREKTLPVFDNHRVARRFATRNQRVFKIPDGRLLQKAAPYLLAKGITRLLIDGQVYSI